MRVILILWAIPLVLFWGWFGLSAYDINFGTQVFSRPFHDHMFAVYGYMLHMPPAEVPAKIAAVFAFDTALLLGVAAFRWRKTWVPQTLSWLRDVTGWDYEHSIPQAVYGEDDYYVRPGLKMNEVGQAHPAE